MSKRAAIYFVLIIATAIIIFIVIATILKTTEATRDFMLSLAASSLLWYTVVNLSDRDKR